MQIYKRSNMAFKRTVLKNIKVLDYAFIIHEYLGQMTQLVYDAGVRSFTYNTYGERESDSLAVDGDTLLVTELRDTFGRSIGYTYAKNGS
mgnify:CR=1 FL=1